MTISTDDYESLQAPPFHPRNTPLCGEVIRSRFPTVDDARLGELGAIWDEVVHCIIHEMLTLSLPDVEQLHINMREEMATDIGNLLHWLGEQVVSKRCEGRELCDIDGELERESCLGAEGASDITSTAEMVYEQFWKRKLNDRWKPKSAKAIEREANPRQASLSVKPVDKNHFIPRWFIRDKWAVDGKILRWLKSEKGWNSAYKPFGAWGYRRDLYSDRLEAYFSLLEGDSKQPIEMLLSSCSLNIPQRDALVGFLVIQVVRNPFFIEAVQREIEPVIAEEGLADNPDMPRLAYETIFKNSKFYNKLAQPIMWSQWALVHSEKPYFVLPDTFGIRGDLGDGLRMIVPLTPNICFVTLPERENAKRILPYHLAADEALALRISAALVEFARNEFLSHSDFELTEVPPPTLVELLSEISQAIAVRDQRDTEAYSPRN